jgi:hypothetical protein
LLFDIAVLWTTFGATGPLPPVAPLMVAYLVGYLPNVLPIPGGIGVLDAGLVGALALYGSPVSHAAAAVLVYHAIAFWVPTLGGLLAYARLRPRLAPTDEIASLREDAADMPTRSDDRVHRRALAAPQGRPAPAIVLHAADTGGRHRRPTAPVTTGPVSPRSKRSGHTAA